MSDLTAEQEYLVKHDSSVLNLWCQTYMGIQFYPYNPTPDMIDIEDIAHALAMKCRYGGHVDDFYSVAEHCVLVSQMVPPEFALEALLHDACEAYIGDMVMPVKAGQQSFQKLEELIWKKAVAPKFGLNDKLSPETKKADRSMLIHEKNTIIRDYGHCWGEWVKTFETYPLPVSRIECWSPADAEYYFLGFFDLYTRGRT